MRSIIASLFSWLFCPGSDYHVHVTVWPILYQIKLSIILEISRTSTNSVDFRLWHLALRGGYFRNNPDSHFVKRSYDIFITSRHEWRLRHADDDKYCVCFDTINSIYRLFPSEFLISNVVRHVKMVNIVWSGYSYTLVTRNYVSVGISNFRMSKKQNGYIDEFTVFFYGMSCQRHTKWKATNKTRYFVLSIAWTFPFSIA